MSTATVDRVLNNRSGVKARTRDAVLEVARVLEAVHLVAEDSRVRSEHVAVTQAGACENPVLGSVHREPAATATDAIAEIGVDTA